MKTKKRGKKRGLDLRKEYKLSWNYLKESRKFIYSIIGIFIFFFFLGFFIAPPEYVVELISEFIRNILEKTQGMSQLELIKFIFFNNIQSSFFGMIFGIVLGIFSIFAAIGNGYLLGFVSSISVGEQGILSLWRLLPHGIFELPAIFISLGLGLKLGSFVFYDKKLKKFTEFFWNSLRTFLLIILPLLIIAGIIEGILIFLSF